MILGLLAEWFLRMHTVLQNYEGIEDAFIKALFIRFTRNGFWTAHIAGWICIIVPWIVIIRHYIAWFNQCGKATSPPAGIQAIVWIQLLLFTSFGIVQILQWFYPHKRRMAEIIYISLSFLAKGLLGLILAFTVIAQD
jgi:hypothetical protein